MRTLIINLLATAVLLLGATSASAMALYATSNTDLSGILSPSDTVTVDVYLDADPGLGFLTVALLYDDDGILSYVPGSSSNPSYILYTGGKGATYLVPLTTPPAPWGGIQQPGKQQINIAYYENAFGSATASGNGIWLASIVFHVDAIGDGQSIIDLTLNANGTIVEAYTVDVSGTTTTSGQFIVNTAVVPEPTTALLIGFGLVGLTLAGRRQD